MRKRTLTYISGVLALLFNFLPGHSQLTVNAGTKMTVSAGMKVNVLGSVSVTTGGELELSGDMTINGSLNNNGLMTILSASESSTGSLIVHGFSTGNLVYRRFITGAKWHMIGSPFSGQGIPSLLSDTANNISFKNGNYAMMAYNEGSNNWYPYFTATTTGDLTVGKGYSMRRESDGHVSFAGTLSNTDLDVPVTRNLHGWNLVSNPWPSAIGITSSAGSTENFLGINAVLNLTPTHAGVYLWDHDFSEYKVINNAGASNPPGTLNQDYVPAGQGFFIRTETGVTDINLTPAMRWHQSDVRYMKSSEKTWPTIHLFAESSNDKSITTITFHSGMTRGLDVTYDAGRFETVEGIAVYTRLLEDNGIDYSIQSLPDDELGGLVIPVGLEAPPGESITLRAEISGFPERLIVYLDDREMGVQQRIGTGTNYQVVPGKPLAGTGRFYLHTLMNTTGREDFNSVDPYLVRILPEEDLIRVESLLNQPVHALVFDLSGKLIAASPTIRSEQGKIRMNYVPSGIYIIHIQSGTDRVVRKINWMKSY